MHGYSNLLGNLLEHHPMQCMGARGYLSEVLTQLIAFNISDTYPRLGSKRAALTGSVAVIAVKRGCISQMLDLCS